MRFIPSADFRSPHPRVRAKLYDVVECLRVADDLLDIAQAVFWPDKYACDGDLAEAQFTARFFACIFQEVIGDVSPTIPEGAFHAVRIYENREPLNSPGIERCVIALELARRSLAEACQLSSTLDGDEVDEAWELMSAAGAAINSCATFLDGATSFFGLDQAIDLILAGEPVTSRAELRERRSVELVTIGA